MFKCAESIILEKPPSVLRLVPSVLVPSLFAYTCTSSPSSPRKKKTHIINTQW